VFLMHGFPYDIHAYADVVPLLVARGCRVVVPCLRGFGRPASCATPHRAQASRPRWAPTCWR
jgi:pimeloyl-ACP methyl ester carboxylesterase